MKIGIALIRHGETVDSAGKFDAANHVPLSESGKRAVCEKSAAKAYPTVKRVYSGDFFCCRETAGLIYPPPIAVLKELSILEDVSLKEEAVPETLQGSGFAGGQILYDAEAKGREAMRVIGAEMERSEGGQCAVISHKMILFAILRRYCIPRSGYADWEFPFGGGYMIEYDTVEKTADLKHKI